MIALRRLRMDQQGEVLLTGGGRTKVSREGGIVYRPAAPWSKTTVALLSHLERVGYPYSPRLVGEGFDTFGREMLEYVEGVTHLQAWPDSSFPRIGQMLRELHKATANFRVPPHATWRPWYGRDLPGNYPVIGHCDTGPWNIIALGDSPVALIDWEEAGPVDALFELAQACWLNAQLYDDDLAEKMNLGSPLQRARQVRALVDGYQLSARNRRDFADELVKCALLDAASEAIEARVTENTTDQAPLWAIAWAHPKCSLDVAHTDQFCRTLCSSNVYKLLVHWSSHLELQSSCGIGRKPHAYFR